MLYNSVHSKLLPMHVLMCVYNTVTVYDDNDILIQTDIYGAILFLSEQRVTNTELHLL